MCERPQLTHHSFITKMFDFVSLIDVSRPQSRIAFHVAHSRSRNAPRNAEPNFCFFRLNFVVHVEFAV